MIQHRVRRRVSVVPTPMHLTARDHIDPSDLLFEDGSLCGPQLRVCEIALGELPQRHQPIEGLVPTRHAMCADHGGGERSILWHLTSLAEETGLCGPFRQFASDSASHSVKLPRPKKQPGGVELVPSPSEAPQLRGAGYGQRPQQLASKSDGRGRAAGTMREPCRFRVIYGWERDCQMEMLSCRDSRGGGSYSNE